MATPRSPLIADANILIDYLEADSSILALLARHTGPVYVATAVLERVEQLTPGDCVRLGLIVAEPTLEQLLEAGDGRPGLAFDDIICLAMARDNGWCCVTNDRALRKACGAASVEVRWGLEVMLGLVEKSALSVEDACATAKQVRASNPRFISQAVVMAFEERAWAAAKAATRRKGG